MNKSCGITEDNFKGNIYIGEVNINRSYSISMFQVILLVMTTIGLKNHVFVLPPLIQTAKKDSWMSVLLAVLITTGLLFMLMAVNKKTGGENIFQWLLTRVNKWFVFVLMWLVIFGLFLMGAVTLRETVTWINISQLPETPRLVTALLLGFVSFSLANTNLRSITIINQFLLFFVVLFGFFVAIVNLQYKDYSLLLPVFEHGYRPILKGIIFPMSGFAELFLLLILQHRIKDSFKFRHLVITVLILAGLTLGPLTGAIIEFGLVEAEKFRFPAYEEWELVSIGYFIEHIFFFVIYQWLTGTFIRLAIILFFIKDLLSLFKKYGKYIYFFIFILKYS